MSRDFACDRVVLLREMRYFRSYLGGGDACEDIDISVHCDVHIFEWLVQWIHSPNKPPPLDASSVVSILISSELLEMANGSTPEVHGGARRRNPGDAHRPGLRVHALVSAGGAVPRRGALRLDGRQG